MSCNFFGEISVKVVIYLSSMPIALKRVSGISLNLKWTSMSQSTNTDLIFDSAYENEC